MQDLQSQPFTCDTEMLLKANYRAVAMLWVFFFAKAWDLAKETIYLQGESEDFHKTRNRHKTFSIERFCTQKK